MPAVSCPLCGSRVRIPSPEIHTRLHCSKCHTMFHLNSDRVAVVGNPPDPEQDFVRLKQEVREKIERIPVKKVVGGLVAVILIYLTFSFVMRPAPTLERPAEKAGQALLNEDLSYLQSIAASGTDEDVTRWYESIQPQLNQFRSTWDGRDEAVDVHVDESDEDKTQRRVVISIHPAGPSSVRDISLADPSVASAPAAGSFDVLMVWTRSRWGGWNLDGQETYSTIQPVPTMYESEDP